MTPPDDFARRLEGLAREQLRAFVMTEVLLEVRSAHTDVLGDPADRTRPSRLRPVLDGAALEGAALAGYDLHEEIARAFGRSLPVARAEPHRRKIQAGAGDLRDQRGGDQAQVQGHGGDEHGRDARRERRQDHRSAGDVGLHPARRAVGVGPSPKA